MKKLLVMCLAAVTLFGCGVNKQAQQIKALEKCTYRVVSASNISVAGTDVKRLMNNQDINLGSLPALAFGLLRKDVPLRAMINMEIANPAGNLAAINQFEYKVLINNQELAEGFVDRQISIAAGQSVVVPVAVNVNVYQFISNNRVMSEISDFLRGGDRKGLVTLKIKPSIMVGGTLIKYPGYITIDKEFSSKILL
jgi:LEA14-like dessication related protein